MMTMKTTAARYWPRFRGHRTTPAREGPAATGFSARGDGFTLMELVATMAIMMLLAGAALPIARVHAQRERELELRRDLREIRTAIDRYKMMADAGNIPTEGNTFGYPKDLDTLVNGVVLKGTATAKYKFLRRLPIDPMTGKADWGMRSMQDDPDSKSWGGEDVFDVHSSSNGVALDGTIYSDW
jgi:general secretion pathway protein G